MRRHAALEDRVLHGKRKLDILPTAARACPHVDNAGEQAHSGPALRMHQALNNRHAQADMESHWAYGRSAGGSNQCIKITGSGRSMVFRGGGLATVQFTNKNPAKDFCWWDLDGVCRCRCRRSSAVVDGSLDLAARATVLQAFLFN